MLKASRLFKNIGDARPSYPSVEIVPCGSFRSADPAPCARTRAPSTTFGGPPPHRYAIGRMRARVFHLPYREALWRSHICGVGACRRARSRQDTRCSSVLTRPPRGGRFGGVGTQGASRNEVRRPAARRTQGGCLREEGVFVLRIRPVFGPSGGVELLEGRPASRRPRSAVARRAGQDRRAERVLTRPSTAARTDTAQSRCVNPIDREAMGEYGRRPRGGPAALVRRNGSALRQAGTRPSRGRPPCI